VPSRNSRLFQSWVTRHRLTSPRVGVLRWPEAGPPPTRACQSVAAGEGLAPYSRMTFAAKRQLKLWWTFVTSRPGGDLRPGVHTLGKSRRREPVVYDRQQGSTSSRALLESLFFSDQDGRAANVSTSGRMAYASFSSTRQVYLDEYRADASFDEVSGHRPTRSGQDGLLPGIDQHPAEHRPRHQHAEYWRSFMVVKEPSTGERASTRR